MECMTWQISESAKLYGGQCDHLLPVLVNIDLVGTMLCQDRSCLLHSCTDGSQAAATAAHQQQRCVVVVALLSRGGALGIQLLCQYRHLCRGCHGGKEPSQIGGTRGWVHVCFMSRVIWVIGWKLLKHNRWVKGDPWQLIKTREGEGVGKQNSHCFNRWGGSYSQDCRRLFGPPIGEQPGPRDPWRRIECGDYSGELLRSMSELWGVQRYQMLRTHEHYTKSRAIKWKTTRLGQNIGMLSHLKTFSNKSLRKSIKTCKITDIFQTIRREVKGSVSKDNVINVLFTCWFHAEL